MLGLFNDEGMPFDIAVFRRAVGGCFAEPPKPQFQHSSYWYVSPRMRELSSLKFQRCLQCQTLRNFIFNIRGVESLTNVPSIDIY